MCRMYALKVHLMDPRDPTAAPVCVAPRREGIEYFVEHCAALSGDSAAEISTSGGPAAAGGSGSGSGGSIGSSGAAVSGSDGSAARCPTLVLLTNHGSDAGEMRLMSAVAGAPPRCTHAMLAAEHIRVLSCALNHSQYLQLCFWRAKSTRSPADIPLSQHATCNSRCSPAGRSWRLLHEPPPGVAITDVDVFAGSVVLCERRQGRPAVSVLRFDTAGQSAAAASLLPCSIRSSTFVDSSCSVIAAMHDIQLYASYTFTPA